MSDPRNILNKMFESANRYPNFGDLLVGIDIIGFRCHQKTNISIESPISAFCGLNGTGKSTILQLAATAYSDPDHQSYNISHFIIKTPLDLLPFKSDSKVEFNYWKEDRSVRKLSITRNESESRWWGYRNRPKRKVFFAGIGMYLPRCEQRSFVNKAPFMKVSATNEVSTRIKYWTSKILGCSYNSIMTNKTNLSVRMGNIISSIKRADFSYSEPHMGFGEARTIYLVETLETMTDKSLILIEEPETSLHLSAQHEFANYLVDVSQVKKHQILITTHSEYVLQALPYASRIYFERRETGISTIPGITSLQAKSLMTSCHEKSLRILVEDDVAVAILSEIIRRHDPLFLRTVLICTCGDKNQIAYTIRGLKGTGLKVVGVRDGDQGESLRENLYKLPGSNPPEIEIIQCEKIKEYLIQNYELNLDDMLSDLRRPSGDLPYHEIIKKIAEQISAEPYAILWELAKIYVRSLRETETDTLVQLLKESISE